MAARWPHKPKVMGSSPILATKQILYTSERLYKGFPVPSRTFKLPGSQPLSASGIFLTMNFAEIFPFITSGHAVTRKKWSSTGQHIFMERGAVNAITEDPNGETILFNGIPSHLFDNKPVADEIHLPYLKTASRGKTIKIYTPDFADLFAADWELV